MTSESEKGDIVCVDATTAPDVFTPIFRAISTPRQRRGIRLEAIYWQGLKAFAAAERIGIGEAVERAVETSPPNGNIASIIRVSVARWMSERIKKFEAVTGLEALGSLVHASPVPTFVLSSDKRIVLYNNQLLKLIQSRYPSVSTDMVSKGLRLSIDIRIDQVIARLRGSSTSALTTGFVLGFEGRRLRGTVNFSLLPVENQAMVIAFVTAVTDFGN